MASHRRPVLRVGKEVIDSSFSPLPSQAMEGPVVPTAFAISFALSVLLLVASAFAQTSPLPWTWAQIPNTRVDPAMPAEGKPGPGGIPEVWNPQQLFAVWGLLFWERDRPISRGFARPS